MSGRASSAAPHSERRLAERRRQSRRRLGIVSGILFFIFCGALLYGLWQTPVRIKNIVIYGADQSLAQVASGALRGAYLGIIPRDSTFFYAGDSIRAALAATDANIAAVSLFRDGFDGLSVKVAYRVPVARWCPSTGSGQAVIATSTPAALCYFFDANGLIYATSSDADAVNSFAVYVAIATSSDPIGATLPHASALPAAFGFARQLATFGSPVVSVAFRDGEVDDLLASGTRVIYLLGDEQNAFTALSSAKTNLDFTDGSLDYVDLRFSGKVYLKKK